MDQGQVAGYRVDIRYKSGKEESIQARHFDIDLEAVENPRRRVRTTNALEKLNQEIKRRTKVVRIFPNREACLRLVTALAVEQSEKWVTREYRC